MQIRAGARAEARANSDTNGTKSSKAVPGPNVHAGDAQSADLSPLDTDVPAILIFQTSEHYHCLVYVTATDYKRRGWGYAQEPKCEEKWHLEGNGSLLLEGVQTVRPVAPLLCVSRAWDQAKSELET